jgi:hypothetical protein
VDTDRIGSTEKEQDWIQKYRAALDVESGKESLIKAVSATFTKIVGILSFGMRFILRKRAGAPPNATGSKQSTKAALAQTPTMPDRRRNRVQRTVVKQSDAGKHPSLQRRSEKKVS